MVSVAAPFPTAAAVGTATPLVAVSNTCSPRTGRARSNISTTTSAPGTLCSPTLVANDRETLSRLTWSHPDPQSDLMMINQFRAVEGRMRQQNPEWFND